jgi:hypothetical protein
METFASRYGTFDSAPPAACSGSGSFVIVSRFVTTLITGHVADYRSFLLERLAR